MGRAASDTTLRPGLAADAATAAAAAAATSAANMTPSPPDSPASTAVSPPQLVSSPTITTTCSVVGVDDKKKATHTQIHAQTPHSAAIPAAGLSAFLAFAQDTTAPVLGIAQDMTIIMWNRKFEGITGLDASRVVGRRLCEVIEGPDNQEKIERLFAQAFLECAPRVDVDLPLCSTNGWQAVVRINMAPVEAGEDGLSVAYYGIGEDMTDRVVHEKHYIPIILQANAPIVELDAVGNIIVWNGKAASLTGFVTADVVGKPLLELVEQESRSIVAEQIQQTLSTAVAGLDFELPLITSTGGRVELSLCLTPRMDPLGKVSGIVGIGQDVTERNAKEMEYRRFIDNANAPIFGVDLAGCIEIFNKKAVETSEYLPEDVRGMHLVDNLIAEEFREAVSKVFQAACQGQQTSNVEFPLITKSGRRVEILLNATPRYDHLGNLCGMIGIGQDITERILQEQEYSRLIDTANAPIFGVDRSYRVRIWNKKAVSITGYSTQDTMGQDLLRFISVQYRNAVQQVMSKALDGIETANFEFPLITKDGRRVEILLNATARYDHFGNICGVVGIGQDITDRRIQEREYSRLIDTANAPIFGVNKRGCVNIWNKKAAQITEYASCDVLGANLVENFIPQEYKQGVGDVLAAALRGEGTANFEFPLFSRSGRLIEILLNATTRYNEKGEIIGVVGIGQDITVRIAQEREYRRLIESANAPIVGVDMAGHINIWNEKAAEITQFSDKEAMGCDLVTRFVSEDSRAAVSFAFCKAFQGTGTATFDFPLITKSGHRVEILLNATPRYNELGHIVGVVGIGQDITERLAQEREYTRLIDTANAPIFGVDEEGRVNIWNKKAAEITQYTAEEVMGENLVQKFITEDYREAVGRVLSIALDGIQTANFEFPLMTKTGRRVEILLNATPRLNELRQVIGMVGIGQDITQRIAQEQEYQRLIDTANAPIFGVDANGRVNIWNKKTAEIMQYTTDEVMGQLLVDKFISEDNRDGVAEVLSKALDGMMTANFECPLMTKDGRRVDILLNATSRYNELGQIVGVVGIGQDITERLAQEREYTRLIDTANAPIFGVDELGRVNIWNKIAVDITEFTTSEVMGENLVEKFITDDYKEAVGEVLSKALEGSKTANFEFPLVTKTGRRVEILLNATPRYNELGQVKGMVGIGQDITERLVQEREYTRLIDTANAPIFGVDVEGRVNIWNKNAARITQYTPAEVMGANLVEEFISEDYREAVGSVLSKALLGTETANFEFPLITKSGGRVDILLNATPRLNELNQVIGMVGIGQDITQRIAQEQEYSRMIEKANAPIFGVDVNGCLNIWNRKAAEITQYEFDEVMGKNLVETFISEDMRDAVATVLLKALKGDESANFELPLVTKTGRTVIFLLNATARFDQLGNIVGVIGIGQDITERIAQDQEYTRLIDTANAPIFGVDVNGCVNIWNKKAVVITQFFANEVMGKNLVDEFITEDYREGVGEVLSKALSGIETANFEFPLVTKSGSRVEILLNATSRYNEHGEVIGMVGIGQDITERIAQQEEYSRLIDTANAPIFGVDANMRVNIWNKKAAQITNYSIKEVMGENLVETFISPEFRPPVADVFSKALSGIQTANFEFPLITRPGTRIEILLNATPRMDARGNIVGVVGIGQDITDRIAQEEEYFRLIDSANAPIFGVDTNGCINEWNQKIELITGYHKSNVLGLSLVNTFIIPESREQVLQLLNQALIGIDVGEMELPMTTKEGTFLLLLVNASSKKDMHGNIRGVIGVGQDYTAKKLMEAARVNFLASFSHELRTPLNGLLGMLELLKETELAPKPARYVEMAYVSGSLLLNLINDILDLSKIEAGHLEITKLPFSMEDLLEYSLELFQFKANERNLVLKKEFDPNLPKVVIGDLVRLRQVLLNLLSNAIKFTSNGSITVSCRVSPSQGLPANTRKLLFQVIDTGVGMYPEDKARLFTLFTKLERTKQDNPTGSGLGLAICKQLVELMGGHIDVDSEVNVGSVFYFTVIVRVQSDEEGRKTFGSGEFAQAPLLINSAADAVQIVRSDDTLIQPAQGQIIVVPAKARILVVEDNDFNWEVVKCFLHDDDHLLQWETNGRDAVNAYIQHVDDFDLIFMDCEMPVMNGYAATRMIRQIEQEKGLPRIPILGLTAYAMSGDRQKCLDAGMDDFLVKPIAKESLRKAIKLWMKVRYMGSQNGLFAPIGIASPIVEDGMDLLSGRSPATPLDVTTEPCAELTCDGSTVNSSNFSQARRPSLLLGATDDSMGKNGKALKLAPASSHAQQLDLARAISNLELDDPMAIERKNGRAYVSAAPAPAILAMPMPLTQNSRCSSGPLASFAEDSTRGSIHQQTSVTLPAVKSSALFSHEMVDQGMVKRASFPKSTGMWDQFEMRGRRSDSPSPPIFSRNVSMSSKKSSVSTEGGETEHGIPEVWNDSLQLPPAALHSVVEQESISPFSIDIPEGDAVDYTLGVEQCGGGEELFVSLLEKFAESCEQAMKRIDAAHAQRNFDLLKREAHSLKGSSAYVAALRVSKSAYRVQVACDPMLSVNASRSPSLERTVDECLARLHKEHNILRGYLRRNFAFCETRGAARPVERYDQDPRDRQPGCIVM